MKKRAWALALLCLCLALPAPFARADRAIYAALYMPIFFESKIPDDIGLVSDAVSRLTEEKIGASVQLVPLLYLFGGSDSSNADLVRVSELELLEKQGVMFDVLPDDMPGANLIALDGLLGQYGAEAAAQIGETRLGYARVDGTLWYLPSISDYVASFGVAMRKDIVDKYGIDTSAIHSFADFDDIFTLVSANEPGLRMICPNQTRVSLLGRMKFQDAFPDCVADLSQENHSEVINYYATDAYRETVALFREWYLAGYLPEQMALQNTRAAQFVKAGELFAYTCACKPGIEYETSVDSGCEMVVVPLMDPVITKRSLESTRWGISAQCKNSGKAMQFLNLLYTDGELINLLLYGIEGTHYVLCEDGTIDYPEGITAESVGYRNTLPWTLPNQLLSYVWKGNDPDVWVETDEFNRIAAVSEAIDFTFDPSDLQTENAALNAIVSRYAYGLETGQLDPAVYLGQMLSEMTAMGADSVVTEVQRQYDEYLERKDESP